MSCYVSLNEGTHCVSTAFASWPGNVSVSPVKLSCFIAHIFGMSKNIYCYCCVLFFFCFQCIKWSSFSHSVLLQPLHRILAPPSWHRKRLFRHSSDSLKGNTKTKVPMLTRDLANEMDNVILPLSIVFVVVAVTDWCTFCNPGRWSG